MSEIYILDTQREKRYYNFILVKYKHTFIRKNIGKLISNVGQNVYMSVRRWRTGCG